MISFMAAAAAVAPTNEFCFDCPTESSFYAGVVAMWLVLSLIFALPGFFAGMLVHRSLARVPLVFRSLIVFGCVPTFWVLLVGQGGLDLLGGTIFAGSLLAAVASSIDGLRVDAEHSAKSFSEH